MNDSPSYSVAVIADIHGNVALMEIIKLDMPECGGMGRNGMWKITN